MLHNCNDTLMYVKHVLQISNYEVFRFVFNIQKTVYLLYKGTQSSDGVTSSVTCRTTRVAGFVTVVTVVTPITFCKGI